ncbi:MAG: hypothetical protein ACI93P_001313 [bacterium]|jgi:hypothetical protein
MRIIPLHRHCHLTPIVASGKAYSITFFKEDFRKKKIKERAVPNTLVLQPAQKI